METAQDIEVSISAPNRAFHATVTATDVSWADRSPEMPRRAQQPVWSSAFGGSTDVGSDSESWDVPIATGAPVVTSAACTAPAHDGANVEVEFVSLGNAVAEMAASYSLGSKDSTGGGGFSDAVMNGVVATGTGGEQQSSRREEPLAGTMSTSFEMRPIVPLAETDKGSISCEMMTSSPVVVGNGHVTTGMGSSFSSSSTFSSSNHAYSSSTEDDLKRLVESAEGKPVPMTIVATSSTDEKAVASSTTQEQPEAPKEDVKDASGLTTSSAPLSMSTFTMTATDQHEEEEVPAVAPEMPRDRAMSLHEGSLLAHSPAIQDIHHLAELLEEGEEFHITSATEHEPAERRDSLLSTGSDRRDSISPAPPPISFLAPSQPTVFEATDSDVSASETPKAPYSTPDGGLAAREDVPSGLTSEHARRLTEMSVQTRALMELLGESDKLLSSVKSTPSEGSPPGSATPTTGGDKEISPDTLPSTAPGDITTFTVVASEKETSPDAAPLSARRDSTFTITRSEKETSPDAGTTTGPAHFTIVKSEKEISPDKEDAGTFTITRSEKETSPDSGTTGEAQFTIVKSEKEISPDAGTKGDFTVHTGDVEPPATKVQLVMLGERCCAEHSDPSQHPKEEDKGKEIEVPKEEVKDEPMYKEPESPALIISSRPAEISLEGSTPSMQTIEVKEETKEETKAEPSSPLLSLSSRPIDVTFSPPSEAKDTAIPVEIHHVDIREAAAAALAAEGKQNASIVRSLESIAAGDHEIAVFHGVDNTGAREHQEPKTFPSDVDIPVDILTEPTPTPADPNDPEAITSHKNVELTETFQVAARDQDQEHVEEESAQPPSTPRDRAMSLHERALDMAGAAAPGLETIGEGEEKHVTSAEDTSTEGRRESLLGAEPRRDSLLSEPGQATTSYVAAGDTMRFAAEEAGEGPSGEEAAKKVDFGESQAAPESKDVKEEFKDVKEEPKESQDQSQDLKDEPKDTEKPLTTCSDHEPKPPLERRESVHLTSATPLSLGAGVQFAPTEEEEEEGEAHAPTTPRDRAMSLHERSLLAHGTAAFGPSLDTIEEPKEEEVHITSGDKHEPLERRESLISAIADVSSPGQATTSFQAPTGPTLFSVEEGKEEGKEEPKDIKEEPKEVKEEAMEEPKEELKEVPNEEPKEPTVPASPLLKEEPKVSKEPESPLFTITTRPLEAPTEAKEEPKITTKDSTEPESPLFTITTRPLEAAAELKEEAKEVPKDEPKEETKVEPASPLLTITPRPLEASKESKDSKESESPLLSITTRPLEASSEAKEVESKVEPASPLLTSTSRPIDEAKDEHKDATEPESPLTLSSRPADISLDSPSSPTKPVQSIDITAPPPSATSPTTKAPSSPHGVVWLTDSVISPSSTPVPTSPTSLQIANAGDPSTPKSPTSIKWFTEPTPGSEKSTTPESPKSDATVVPKTPTSPGGWFTEEAASKEAPASQEAPATPKTPGVPDGIAWITETPDSAPSGGGGGRPEAKSAQDSEFMVNAPWEGQDRPPKTPTEADGIAWITEEAPGSAAPSRPTLERSESTRSDRDASSASEITVKAASPMKSLAPSVSADDDLASGVMAEEKGTKMRKLSWADQKEGFVPPKEREDADAFNIDDYERRLNETTAQTRDLVNLLCQTGSQLAENTLKMSDVFSNGIQADVRCVLDDERKAKEAKMTLTPIQESNESTTPQEPPPQLVNGALPANVDSVIISSPELKGVTGSIVLTSGNVLVTDDTEGLFLFSLDSQVVKHVSRPEWKQYASPVQFKDRLKNYILVLMHAKDAEGYWVRSIVKFSEDLEYIEKVECPKWIRDRTIVSERISVTKHEDIFYCVNGEIFSGLYELSTLGRWTESLYRQSESFVDMLAFSCIGPITQVLIVEGRKDYVMLVSIRESQCVDVKRMALCERPGALARDEAGRLFVMNRAQAAVQLVDTCVWASMRNVALVDKFVPHFGAAFGMLAIPQKKSVKIQKYAFEWDEW